MPIFPGSAYDAAIFRVSDIRHYLMQQYYQGDRSSHLIADSGYGIEPWIFTPFHNPQPNSPEDRFNHQHCSARNVIK